MSQTLLNFRLTANRVNVSTTLHTSPDDQETVVNKLLYAVTDVKILMGMINTCEKFPIRDDLVEIESKSKSDYDADVKKFKYLLKSWLIHVHACNFAMADYVVTACLKGLTRDDKYDLFRAVNTAMDNGAF